MASSFDSSWTANLSGESWSRPVGQGFETALMCWQEKLHAMSQPAIGIVIPLVSKENVQAAWVKTALHRPGLVTKITQEQDGSYRLRFKPFQTSQQARHWASKTVNRVNAAKFASPNSLPSAALHQLWDVLAALPRLGIPNEPESYTSKLSVADLNDEKILLIIEAHHIVCDMAGLIDIVQTFLSELEESKASIEVLDVRSHLDPQMQASRLPLQYIDALGGEFKVKYEEGSPNDALIKQVVSPSQGIPLKSDFAGRSAAWPQLPSTCFHAQLSRSATTKLLQHVKARGCSLTHVVGAALQVGLLSKHRSDTLSVTQGTTSCAVPIVIDARRLVNGLEGVSNASEMSALFCDTSKWDADVIHGTHTLQSQINCLWAFVEEFDRFRLEHISSVDKVINKGLHELWAGYGTMMAAMSIAQVPSPPSTAMGCNSLGDLDKEGLAVEHCQPLARTWGATTIPHVYTLQGQLNINLNYVPAMFEDDSQEDVILDALQLLGGIVEESAAVKVIYRATYISAQSQRRYPPPLLSLRRR